LLRSADGTAAKGPVAARLDDRRLCAAAAHAAFYRLAVRSVPRPGLDHIAASTGATSEQAMQRLYDLPDHALIDMGDFVGGALKYLRAHPVARLTIASGFAKLAKLAGGHLDLHSARSRVDTTALGEMLATLGADTAAVEVARVAPGAAEILALAGARREALAGLVAARAREVALATLSGKTAIEVAIVDREGEFLARIGG
jgi:cobalt-precorrin-5B (C1)-methyltransferase